MAAKKPRIKSIADQIASDDRKVGEEYTFPHTGFTVRIKPVGSHLMLMGGAVPNGYDVKKFTDTIYGQVEEPTAEHIDIMNKTMEAVVKEAVRRGWPSQYEDFEALMLPKLPYEDFLHLFQYLMHMEGVKGGATLFPGIADREEA